MFGSLQAAEATGGAASHPALPTGFRDVDRLLSIGGLPKGQFTELMGCGTAGQATLATKTSRQAQQARRQGVYVDASRAAELRFLHRHGIGIDALTTPRSRCAGRPGAEGTGEGAPLAAFAFAYRPRTC